MLRIVLFISTFLLLTELCWSQDATTRKQVFGFDVGAGFARGTESFGIQGVIGFPNNNMSGRDGWQASVFYQTNLLYIGGRFVTLDAELSDLFNTPTRANQEASFLAGIASPLSWNDNWFTVSAATGLGLIWGTARGELISANFGKSYKKEEYIAVSIPIELRMSQRLFKYYGLGLKYNGSLNSFYSSSMYSLFFETLF